MDPSDFLTNQTPGYAMADVPFATASAVNPENKPVPGAPSTAQAGISTGNASFSYC